MTRWCGVVCAAVWLALPAAAQDPVLELEFDAEAPVVVGQPVALRLTVLVPTFMPQPPALPSFETPDLMVRLNGRATNPTSRRIEGATWSGITRSYSLYPMVPGRFDLPPQEVAVTYMGASSTEQRLSIPTEAVSFTATVPEGAEAMDPLLIATGLRATQTITVPEGELTVGDAVQRTVEITIDGTSPLFLPPLLEPLEGGQLRAYPAPPTLTEAEDRGVLSGTRIETASYITLAEGSAALPALTLDWFNLDSGAVETVTLEGATFEISPGPAPPIAWDRAMLVRLVLGALALGAAMVGFARYGVPRLRAWRAARQADRRRSEPVMYRRVTAMVTARDMTGTLAALAAYTTRHGAGGLPPGVDAALGRVTETCFGTAPCDGTDAAARWAALAGALPELRAARDRTAPDATLPALNPDWGSGGQSPV